MADQKKVTEPENGETSVIRNVSDFASDVMTLVDLQWRLVLLDAREGGKAVVPSAGLLLAGITVLLTTLPILMVSLACALVEFAHLPASAAFLMTAVIGMVVGGVLAWLGWGGLQKTTSLFARSRQEFDANTRWMKHVLQRLGASQPSSASRRF